MAGDAALSARSPVARSVADTSLPRCPGQVRISALAPLGRGADEPVGVARRVLGPMTTPHDRPANRSAARGGSVAFVPRTGAADADLPKRGSGPFSGVGHPKVAPIQTRLPGPGRRCAVRYGAHLDRRITPGQGVFCNAQGSPQIFHVSHRKRSFIHRSCTTLPPTVERHGPTAVRTQPQGCHCAAARRLVPGRPMSNRRAEGADRSSDAATGGRIASRPEAGTRSRRGPDALVARRSMSDARR
jgi:hypothetical protein